MPKTVADIPGTTVNIETSSSLVAEPNADREYGVLYNPTADDIASYTPTRIYIRLHESGAVAGSVAFPLEPGEKWDFSGVATGISAYHASTGTKYLWKAEV